MKNQSARVLLVEVYIAVSSEQRAARRTVRRAENIVEKTTPGQSV